jgi:tRNA(fMet)-specific endonuclease VapC
VKYLVDTDWVVDWLSGQQRAIDLLAQLSVEGLAISALTYAEIYEGVYYGRDPRAAEAVFKRFLQDVPVLMINRSVLKRYAMLRGDLRRRGLLIGDPDSLIAATALFHNLSLVTRNLAHFQRVPGLAIYSPQT